VHRVHGDPLAARAPEKFRSNFIVNVAADAAVELHNSVMVRVGPLHAGDGRRPSRAISQMF
jgi:hypothetical protein